MAGICWRSNTYKPNIMNRTKIISILTNRDPKITFMAGDTYYWSPKNRTVFYQEADTSELGLWTLLHEASHGILEHKQYMSDFELIHLELEAWQEADKIAKELNIEIDKDHVQDCVDSYRDWQYKRSLCPSCELGGIQIASSSYRCLFCNNSWSVSSERFCRPYRRAL